MQAQSNYNCTATNEAPGLIESDCTAKIAVDVPTALGGLIREHIWLVIFALHY